MISKVITSSSSGVSADTLEEIKKNQNHPLYLHPSDTPGSVLTSVQLTGTPNYSLWSRSLMIKFACKEQVNLCTWILSKIILQA